jgi:hypothetical protein
MTGFFRNHHRRAGEFIDEPQQGDLVEAFADLRGDLPPPEQAEIPGLNQPPASALTLHSSPSYGHVLANT